MQTGNQCHRNSIESVSGAEAIDQPKLRAKQFQGAAQSRNRSGYDKAHKQITLYIEPVHLRGGHVQADCPKLESGRGIEQEREDDDANHNRNGKCDGD